MSAIARIIDANANRAREAMRVMEDVARFALNDEPLSRALKSLRHDLHAAFEQFPPGWIEANRDTPGDVGTTITTERETTRAGLIDIVSAAAKRLTEALRTIEECAKTLDTTRRPSHFSGAMPVPHDQPLAQTIESLRYRAYAVETDLLLMLGTGRARQWRLCLLLTESICRKPWRDVLQAALDAGADCLQIREKTMGGGKLADRMREVIDIARPAGASVVVNDRVDVALAAGADGVHLGTGDLSLRDTRRLAGRTLLIGASTHTLDEADAAVRAGADYCGVGAMFASSLKPDRRPAGPAYLREFIDRYPDTPHLAIGGITPGNIHALAAAGVRGVAVSTAICAADDPAAAARAILAALPSQTTTKPITAR
jgi:thiamine-phosphate pyrophosphorylase